jgi:signal-transduction protein with cAMP-binding, CBS, and nucleotidyltransferase domain
MKEDDIVGFFTEGDIKKDVVAKGLKPDIPVKEIMTTDLITVNIGDEIKDVLQTMTDKNIKHVLVREDGEIVGIVTFRDLIDIERRRLETYISRE